jgi:hypothetical protein
MNHSIDDMSQIFKDASENSKMKKRDEGKRKTYNGQYKAYNIANVYETL